MRYYKFVLGGLVVMGIVAFFSDLLFASRPKIPPGQSFYDFKATSLEGDEVDFSQFRGRYVLIVNTASKCGYTPQYAELQKLHEMFGDRLSVLGFPANNFLWQEPGDDNDIATFCEQNYGVTFRMFSKISVKGKNRHPLYAWLDEKSGKSPSWNFCKYLVDKDGNVIGFFPPKVKPLDPQIIDKLI